MEELQFRLASDVMIRRLKKDVLTQLPPKQRQRVPFQIKESDFKKVCIFLLYYVTIFFSNCLTWNMLKLNDFMEFHPWSCF